VGQVPGAAKEDEHCRFGLMRCTSFSGSPCCRQAFEAGRAGQQGRCFWPTTPPDLHSGVPSLALTRCRYNKVMLILLVLLLVLLFAGLGFALHFLWILAVIFFVFWLAGVALGRGESAGNHRFYRW
jgi:hypothetical protein